MDATAMSDKLQNLIRIKRNAAESAVKVLSTAFKDYQLFHYYFTDHSKRQKISNYFLSFAVYAGIKYGEVYATSENFEGIAVWIPSKNLPLTYWKLFRSIPLSKIIGFAIHGGLKLRHFIEYVDLIHQNQAPFKHWFLQVIGVAPIFQGKGYGSKLIKPMLSRIDSENLPCYLNTISQKNISIYERFSFATIDQTVIPETSIVNWAMLRKAQQHIHSN